MANITEYAYPGDVLTFTPTAPVTGGQLVELTGNRTIGPAGATSTKVCGVAQQDAATGVPVGVRSKGVVGLTASGAVTTGQRLVAGAAGVAVAVAVDTDARMVIGYALEAITSGQVGRVKLINLG